MDMSLSKLGEIVKDREAWYDTIHGITKSQTWLSNWTTTKNPYKKGKIWAKTEIHTGRCYETIGRDWSDACTGHEVRMVGKNIRRWKSFQMAQRCWHLDRVSAAFRDETQYTSVVLSNLVCGNWYPVAPTFLCPFLSPPSLGSVCVPSPPTASHTGLLSTSRCPLLRGKWNISCHTCEQACHSHQQPTAPKVSLCVIRELRKERSCNLAAIRLQPLPMVSPEKAQKVKTGYWPQIAEVC